MALLEKQLELKASTIPTAGTGLFTKIFISKGTLIVEYKGKIKTWKEIRFASKGGYVFEYIYEINANRFIDASRFTSALAKYANDANGMRRVKGVTNNCIYVNDGKSAFIQAVKDIPAGGEILVRYGKTYWDVKRAHLAK